MSHVSGRGTNKNMPVVARQLELFKLSKKMNHSFWSSDIPASVFVLSLIRNEFALLLVVNKKLKPTTAITITTLVTPLSLKCICTPRLISIGGNKCASQLRGIYKFSSKLRAFVNIKKTPG